MNSPDRDISSHTEIGRVKNLICARVGKNGLGVNTSLVCESTETSDVVVAKFVRLHPRQIGFITHKGTDISTASATKFSISLNMGRLYLDLTYSGSATIIRAIRPPRGVIPFRSPIPS